MDRLHLEKSNLGKVSLVQLATGTKRRIHDMVNRKNRVNTMHNIQEATTIGDMGRIYAALNDRQA